MRRHALRWIPKGTAVTVGGIRLPHGRIFFGEPWPPGSNRCGLDPALSVASKVPPGLEYHSYYPGYAYMTPELRLIYLRWLAGGMQDPDIHPTFVHVYFYNLERRLFLDRAFDEAADLIGEARRLKRLYGRHRGLGAAIDLFLEFGRLLTGDESPGEPPPASPGAMNGLSIGLRIGLAREVLNKRAITADWMLAWVLAHHQTRLPNAARRVFDELCRLFRQRFTAEYPQGLPVRLPRSEIGTVAYVADSGDFSSVLEGPFERWPDVRRMMKPVETGRQLLGRCVLELEPLDRFLRKSPEARDSLHATLLLPSSLIRHENPPAIRALAAWLEEIGRRGSIDWGTLVRRLDIAVPEDGKLGKPMARLAAEILERLGFGVEPDVRLDGAVPKAGEPAFLFRLPDGTPEPGLFGRAYAAAAAVVALSALFLDKEGGEQAKAERRRAVLALVPPALKPAEHSRLEAHASWLRAVPPSVKQVATGLPPLDAAGRAEMGALAVRIAAMGGHVTVARVKVLERLYQALGLERALLFSEIHQLGQAADEPVLVRRRAGASAGHGIPPRPRGGAAASGVALDLRRVERSLADTARVSALLSGIFVEEPVAAPVEEGSSPGGGFAGLDRRHDALLRELLTRARWSAAEFAGLCRRFELLPDGALETLNEWSFDRFDEAIVEDDGEFAVNRALLGAEASAS